MPWRRIFRQLCRIEGPRRDWSGQCRRTICGRTAAADHVGKWGRFNTRMLEIGETPLSIIVKSVPDEVRDDVTAAIEAVARQGSVPPSFNLVYFASSSPTNTASKTA